ncbi:WD40 repeat domain-containing protein, partial [Endozoicomonas sp. ONNA1]|uniref:WD40 repeat domain-containing protein n=1 Tax=Endozoicomonas sp. ONNA1 TaxID=2828740 RepID=UPI002148B34E
MSTAVLASSAQPSSSRARTIQLDNNNFNHYLNPDHPVEGHYELIGNIDLQLADWKPVGNASKPFSVTLLGNGHIISGLKVSTFADNAPSGLFGSLENSTIRQILLNRPRVTSTGNKSPTGALAGELKGSRVEEVFNFDGTIQTSGFHSHGGGIAGSVSDSIVHNSLNNGTVFITGSASKGGIAGLADQSSSISNNLNTGKISSRNSDYSPAGGIVGTLRSKSVANSNTNTGEVTVRHTESSGGIAGEAEAVRILHNLNTGRIASEYLNGTSRRAGRSGGIVGKAFRQTLVSKNLNTGNIFSNYYDTHAGGIAGQVINAAVVQNVNVGTVTTRGQRGHAGGIAGQAEGGSTHDNLNAGAIITESMRADLGGISGAATLSASVYNNVNTGSVKAQAAHSYMSGAVGRVAGEGRIEKNLDTFTKYQPTDGSDDGRNTGIIRLSNSDLKSNLNGLNSTLWNAGDTSQLPMLRGINTPYRELVRINGTKQVNNQLPTVLNEFADPGGAANATSFNRTVWNGRNGYLPFPKVFFEPPILLIGIDCMQGGFDCGKRTPPQLIHEIEIDPDRLPKYTVPTPDGPDLTRHCSPHRIYSISWNRNDAHIALAITSGPYPQTRECRFAGAVQIFGMDASGNFELLYTMKDPKIGVWSLDYNHDGSRLAVGSYDRNVWVYNVLDGYTLEHVLDDSTKWVRIVKYNHDGTLLAAGSSDGKVRIYNGMYPGIPLYTLTAPNGIRSLDYNRDDTRLATVGNDAKVRIYNGRIPTSPLQTLSDPEGHIWAVVYNHNSTQIAAGGNDHKVWIYNGTNPTSPLHVLYGATSSILCIDYSRDDTQLAAGGFDYKVRIYEVRNSSNLLYILPDSKNTVRSVKYSHNGKWLAAGGDDQRLRIYKIDTSSSSTQPATDELTTASVHPTLLSSESPSEASSAVPSSSVQPTTSGARTIQLDNNNFNQYLNAEHPVEGRYELTGDIDLRSVDWKPVGNISKPFSVTLLGNGHVISGLKVSTSADNTPSGLFGSLQYSTIRQVLLQQPKVISTGDNSPTGALVGELKGSKIEEVVNSAGSIQTGGLHSHGGGIAGSVSDSVIRDSVNTGTVFTTGSASKSGIAGLAVQSSSISNNLNTGKISSRDSYNSPAGG